MRNYRTASYDNDEMRSRRASEAQSEGRYPASRAAEKLGVSLAAFRAGCRAANYCPDEWHHVGLYAQRVDFYDVVFLKTDSDFWRGVAAAQRGGKMSHAARAVKLESFRRQLVQQRDCSRAVKRHTTKNNWCKYCEAQGLDMVGRYMSGGYNRKATEPGNFAALCVEIDLQFIRRRQFALRLHAELEQKHYAEACVALLNATLRELGFSEEPTANWHKTRNTCWRKHGCTVSNVYGVFRGYPVHVYAPNMQEIATGSAVEIAHQLEKIMAPVEAAACGRARYNKDHVSRRYGEIQGD